MKTFLFVLLISFLNITGQIRITFTDHIEKSNGDIIVTVFAQNLGTGVNINSICANSMFSSNADQYQLHFYLAYDDILNDHKITKKLPSSIMIKTILGTMTPMDELHYYFSFTRSSMGQEWEINFTDVPNNAGDVTIVVLGEHLLSDV